MKTKLLKLEGLLEQLASTTDQKERSKLLNLISQNKPTNNEVGALKSNIINIINLLMPKLDLILASTSSNTVKNEIQKVIDKPYFDVIKEAIFDDQEEISERNKINLYEFDQATKKYFTGYLDKLAAYEKALHLKQEVEHLQRENAQHKAVTPSFSENHRQASTSDFNNKTQKEFGSPEMSNFYALQNELQENKEALATLEDENTLKELETEFMFHVISHTHDRLYWLRNQLDRVTKHSTTQLNIGAEILKIIPVVDTITHLIQATVPNSASISKFKVVTDAEGMYKEIDRNLQFMHETRAKLTNEYTQFSKNINNKQRNIDTLNIKLKKEVEKVLEQRTKNLNTMTLQLQKSLKQLENPNQSTRNDAMEAGRKILAKDIDYQDHKIEAFIEQHPELKKDFENYQKTFAQFKVIKNQFNKAVKLFSKEKAPTGINSQVQVSYHAEKKVIPDEKPIIQRQSNYFEKVQKEMAHNQKLLDQGKQNIFTKMEEYNNKMNALYTAHEQQDYLEEDDVIQGQKPIVKTAINLAIVGVANLLGETEEDSKQITQGLRQGGTLIKKKQEDKKNFIDYDQARQDFFNSIESYKGLLKKSINLQKEYYKIKGMLIHGDYPLLKAQRKISQAQMEMEFLQKEVELKKIEKNFKMADIMANIKRFEQCREELKNLIKNVNNQAELSEFFLKFIPSVSFMLFTANLVLPREDIISKFQHIRGEHELLQYIDNTLLKLKAEYKEINSDILKIDRNLTNTKIDLEIEQEELGNALDSALESSRAELKKNISLLQQGNLIAAKKYNSEGQLKNAINQLSNIMMEIQKIRPLSQDVSQFIQNNNDMLIVKKYAAIESQFKFLKKEFEKSYNLLQSKYNSTDLTIADEEVKKPSPAIGILPKSFTKLQNPFTSKAINPMPAKAAQPAPAKAPGPTLAKTTSPSSIQSTGYITKSPSHVSSVRSNKSSETFFRRINNKPQQEAETKNDQSKLIKKIDSSFTST